VADLRLRLVGEPGEVAALVDDMRESFEYDPILKRISDPLPARKEPGRVRVYIVLDGTLLAEDLRASTAPQGDWEGEPCL